MTILIVDDEVDLREMVSSVLEKKLKLKTLCVGSIEEAIKTVKQNKDITGIICDYYLKNATGKDLLKFLVKSKLKIPFILCSGDDSKIKEDFEGLPLAGFLQKPFSMINLTALVQSIVPKSKTSVLP